MRNKLALVFAIFAAPTIFAGSASAQATKWQNDPNHSGAYFQVRFMGVDNIRGDFSKMTAVVMYDPANPAKTTVETTIDATSIDTNVVPRDKDLIGPNYFDTEKFPTITFKSTSFTGSGTSWKMAGDLTIHGVTKQVTLDVSGPTMVKDDKGASYMGAEATVTINRKDFGITANPAVGDMVPITLELDLKPAAPPKADTTSSSAY